MPRMVSKYVVMACARQPKGITYLSGMERLAYKPGTLGTANERDGLQRAMRLCQRSSRRMRMVYDGSSAATPSMKFTPFGVMISRMR